MNSWAALFFSIRWLSLHFLVCLSRRACFHWQQKEEKQNLLARLFCVPTSERRHNGKNVLKDQGN